MNVIVGERYKQISNQVIQYALGFWGEAESAAVKPDVRDKILSSPRAKELARWQPPEPSIEEVRQQFGGAGISDDELLLRYLAGNEAVAVLRAAPPRSERSVDGRLPLVTLVNELAKKSSLSQIKIKKNGFLLHMARAERAGS